jgi:hypothetical protein
MRYVVVSRKAIVLDGETYYPGDFVEDPSNSRQLIRRGLAVPLDAKSAPQGDEKPATKKPEQAEARSPSSEPAHSTSKAEPAKASPASATRVAPTPTLKKVDTGKKAG